MGKTHLVRVNGHIIWWPQVYAKGLKYPHQLFSQGTWITAQEAHERFSMSQMQLNSIKTSIPKIWIQECKDGIKTECNIHSKWIKEKKLANKVYKLLTENKNATSNKRFQWCDELHTYIDEATFLRALKQLYTVSNVPKLRSFQFRLLHRGLVLNTHLFHWKMRDTNQCSFCDNDVETLCHIFFNCPEVRKIWDQATQFIANYDSAPLELTPQTVILNKVGRKGSVSNLIVSIIKQYIYRQRCKNMPLNFEDIRYETWSVQNKEKFIAQKNNKLDRHYAKWCINNPWNYVMPPPKHQAYYRIFKM